MTYFDDAERARIQSEAAKASTVTNNPRQQKVWHTTRSYLAGELTREQHRAARERKGDRGVGQAS
jgi:hypothetical protein